RAGEVVLRSPMLTRSMVDLYLRDAATELTGNRRKVPVHAGTQLERLDHLRAVHLQRAAVVVEAHAGDDAEQPVGDRGWHVAREEAVLPPAPPAGHDVLPPRERQHRGNIVRVVLQIAVERDDVIA